MTKATNTLSLMWTLTVPQIGVRAQSCNLQLILCPERFCEKQTNAIYSLWPHLQLVQLQISNFNNYQDLSALTWYARWNVFSESPWIYFVCPSGDEPKSPIQNRGMDYWTKPPFTVFKANQSHLFFYLITVNPCSYKKAWLTVTMCQSWLGEKTNFVTKRKSFCEVLWYHQVLIRQLHSNIRCAAGVFSSESRSNFLYIIFYF